MTHAKKVDANQSEIVAEFRRLGWEVFDSHCIGKGFPDLVVSKWCGNVHLIEVKNGNADYTPDEIEFIEKFPVTTIRHKEDVDVLFGSGKQIEMDPSTWLDQ
jgi:hypothetical protein